MVSPQEDSTEGRTTESEQSAEETVHRDFRHSLYNLFHRACGIY